MGESGGGELVLGLLREPRGVADHQPGNRPAWSAGRAEPAADASRSRTTPAHLWMAGGSATCCGDPVARTTATVRSRRSGSASRPAGSPAVRATGRPTALPRRTPVSTRPPAALSGRCGPPVARRAASADAPLRNSCAQRLRVVVEFDDERRGAAARRQGCQGVCLDGVRSHGDGRGEARTEQCRRDHPHADPQHNRRAAATPSPHEKREHRSHAADTIADTAAGRHPASNPTRVAPSRRPPTGPDADRTGGPVAHTSPSRSFASRAGRCRRPRPLLDIGELSVALPPRHDCRRGDRPRHRAAHRAPPRPRCSGSPSRRPSRHRRPRSPAPHRADAGTAYGGGTAVRRHRPDQDLGRRRRPVRPCSTPGRPRRAWPARGGERVGDPGSGRSRPPGLIDETDHAHDQLRVPDGFRLDRRRRQPASSSPRRLPPAQLYDRHGGTACRGGTIPPHRHTRNSGGDQPCEDEDRCAPAAEGQGQA